MAMDWKGPYRNEQSTGLHQPKREIDTSNSPRGGTTKLETPYFMIRKLTLHLQTSQYSGVVKEIEIPEYGEVKIISHGKDIRIETTVKEKVE